MASSIQTRLGRLSIPDDRVITFPDGIIGFENHKRFALVDRGDDGPFRWLVSLDDPKLAFVVVVPTEFMNEYKVEFSAAALEKLGLDGSEADSDLLILAIVTVPRNPAEMTANLVGPLVIHAERRIGYQLIVEQNGYSARHPILEEIRHSFKRRAESPAIAVSTLSISA